jgi:hypothetical protein
VASFNFASNVYTGLLATGSDALTGNLTGKTVSATVSVSGMNPGATFQEQNGGGCTPDHQTVRLYFATSGAGSGTGFFTHFWWSNPTNASAAQVLLLANVGASPMSVALDPANWSDWNGHLGTFSPAVTAAFNTAITKVTTIGLSFGGGCFFKNGVTSDGSGTFTLNSFAVTP